MAPEDQRPPKTPRTVVIAVSNLVSKKKKKVRRAKGAVAWQREEDPITVFMGVPTMYSYLLAVYDKMAPEEQAAARAAAARLRLTVSGSAACPLPIMQRWEELSGALAIWQPLLGQIQS